MYDGRDMTELSMMSKHEWQDDELGFFSSFLTANHALFKYRGAKLSQ